MLHYKLPPISNPIYSTTLTVQINNINYGQHLGHDALIALLHEARVRYLRSLGFTESNIEGLGILVTNLVVNYRQEAFYGDELIIHLALGEFRKTGLELLHQVEHQHSKKEIARALTGLTFYHFQTKSVEKIPKAFLAALNRH